MKKILLMGAIGLSVFVLAQNNPEPIKYSEVVKVSDSTKTAKQLFSSAKLWFTKSFKNPKDVLVLDDPEAGTLVGKGTMSYNSNMLMGSAARKGFISFEVTISCKDGRYKYVISDFYHKGSSITYGIITNQDQLSTMTGWNTGGESFRQKVTKELKETIENNIQPMIVLLKSEMEKKPATKEDW